MHSLTFQHDAGGFGIRLTERLPRPRGTTVCVLRSIIQWTMRVMLRTYNQLEIVGRENLPAETSFVMVCNHTSHLDAVCLLASLPLRRVHHAFPVAATVTLFQYLLENQFAKGVGYWHQKRGRGFLKL